MSSQKSGGPVCGISVQIIAILFAAFAGALPLLLTEVYCVCALSCCRACLCHRLQRRSLAFRHCSGCRDQPALVSWDWPHRDRRALQQRRWFWFCLLICALLTLFTGFSAFIVYSSVAPDHGRADKDVQVLNARKAAALWHLQPKLLARRCILAVVDRSGARSLVE
jgi:hypothetical protein